MKGQDPSSVSASLLGAPGSSRSGGAKGVLTSHGAFLGMAVTAAVIEVGLDPPIKGLDPLVSEVCGRPLARVPIVRIYGPWGPGGPHCCLHLHGLFPYFYVPAPPEAYGDGASAFLRCFSRRLVLEADRLMAAKARGSQKGSRPAGTRASRDGFNDISLQREARAVRGDERPKGGPLVQKIEVVRRLPFYGYHRDFHFFLKISLTVPDMVGPMAALLLKGAVTGSPLQPFEVHLSFQTQVFADLHLKGMAPVFVDKPFFRLPVVLHPLAAAGVQEGVQGSRLSTDGTPGFLKDENRMALSPEFEMLGVGAPRAFAALGWGRLLQQMCRLQKSCLAPEISAVPGAATAKERDESTKRTSNSSSTVVRLCDLIMKATPPRGPQGLRVLSVPRRSKCVLEVDARVEQVLNPIAAAEVAEMETAAVPIAQNHLGQHTHQRTSPVQNEQRQQACSLNPPTCSSNMNSSGLGSNNNGEAFAARLVGSVAEYWREEAARAAALGFPPPSASGLGSQGGLRDSCVDGTPELWRNALHNTLKRIDAWRQQQKQELGQKSVHQRLPMKQTTSSTILSQPKQQQQQQQQQVGVEVIPSSLSSNWEASQPSVASDPEAEGESYTPGSADAAQCTFLDAPLQPLEPKEHDAFMMPQRRQGRSLGLCSSQAHEGAPCLLSQGRPPSQKASVGLQPDLKVPLPSPDDLHDLADLGDEAFAALLTSQRAEGPFSETGQPERLRGPQRIIPVTGELEALSEGSNADCSSLSDSSSPRRPSRPRKSQQIQRRASEQGPRISVQCNSGRLEQATANSSHTKRGNNGCSCCCSSAHTSERKRCSSDMEDLLLACEARSAAQDTWCSQYSQWRRSSTSNYVRAHAFEATPRDVPNAGEIEASCPRGAFGGFQRAHMTPATAPATLETTTGAFRRVSAAEATIAAVSAPNKSDEACSSSSYTPTVKLDPRSSCDDLSPTQPINASKLRSLWASGLCSDSPKATAAAATATASLPGAEDASADTDPMGNIRSRTRAVPPGSFGRNRELRPSAPSESGVSVISVPPTPAAMGTHTDEPGAATVGAATSGTPQLEEEITPFYSNPRDVPAAVNPFAATPGGRMLQQQRGLTPPPCACNKATAETVAGGSPKTSERVEFQSELLRFLHRQQQLRQLAGKPHPQQHLRGQQEGGSKRCFVYFRPPPDDAQVFGSCPIKVRRAWQQRITQCELQQQQLEPKQTCQQHLPKDHRRGPHLEHSYSLPPSDKERPPQRQQEMQDQKLHQAQHLGATTYGEMLHQLLKEGVGQKPQETEASEAKTPFPREAFDISNSNSSSSRSRRKVRMATRLDNSGRIVSYVDPRPIQQQQEVAFAAATSQSSSSGSSSQEEQSSQVSIASDVLKAKRCLCNHSDEGTKVTGHQGALSGAQTATYGSLLALEIITECPTTAATEAAAAAATPNPWTCAVLAICFVLRDERLQRCASRLQQQQQHQQELLYSDVSGVIICDPVAASRSCCWRPPFSLGVRQKVSGSSDFASIDSCFDRDWWRCVVSTEKELLLQFCSVVAAADPSLLLQWEEGGRGFKFLCRRAVALGIGHLFNLRCSRRADDISSIPVSSAAPRSVVSGPVRASWVPGTAGRPGAAGATKPVGGRPEVRRRRRWVRGSTAVSGRLVLEGWRLLQKEMKLQHSDLNGVAADVLGIITPSIPLAITAAIWQQAQQTRRRKLLQQHQRQSQQEEDLGALQSVANLVSHVMNRVRLCLRLVDTSEVLPRTCELARLYGCSLHSALTRGSQFKVENILLRATKRLNCVLVSPSKQQVTEQPATVGVPLVLEPLSGFYFSPVLVLDFLSLYPSIVIANNICYSTCLGSVEVDPLESEMKTLGVLTVHAPPEIFAHVMQAHADATAAGPSSWPSPGVPGDDPMRVLPGGCIFVSRRVRQGILPTLLNDILQTRIMVKQALKRYQGGGIADQTLLRKLEYRQFGLKMIANVTYGYTNANVSGRMPCADVADAIVETARATLIRAMQLIEQTQKWGARVLYGDTDSIFVLLKGRSLEAAFTIGQEIAEAVTRSNPAPITLQLEKVYLPCCLITKKRYVGNAYFSPTGPPTFDAKGIETIRRDQCPLTSALLEKSLRIFFQTRDLSKVKELLYREWSKMLRGQIPIRHYIFHRRAKLGTYRAEAGEAPAGTLPPQAKVLYERLHHQGQEGGAAAAADCYGMRVPFVFSQVAGDTDVPLGAASTGPKGGTARLIDCATSPENVWGGRRDPTEMQALLNGRVHASVRHFALLQRSEEGLLQQEQQQQLQEQHPVVQLHYRYYITKQIIPAIDRLFSLLPPPGCADLLQWFRDMPKPAQPLAAAMACRSPLNRQQQQKLLLRQQQQSLLHQLGIRSLTASGSARERLVLQSFFAGASCLFCGSRCRELGPLHLSSSPQKVLRLTQANKRKKAIRASAEEAEEAAVRRNLVQQLLHSEFSSPSSSSCSCSNAEKRPISEGLLQRRKRKGASTDMKKRVVLVPPPVCKECSSNPALVCLRLSQRLNKIERRLAAAADLCRHCASSRICAESCLQAWHCDVYYRRNSEAERLKVVQHQMQNLGIYVENGALLARQ